MEMVVVTGLSGAGKSQAIKVMEDLGYYCMDNVPPVLLSKFVELYFDSGHRQKKVAIVMDIRSGSFFEESFQHLEMLTKKGVGYKILFLDAKDEVLIKRFKELRRPHPLSKKSIQEGILEERKILEGIKSKADYYLRTDNFTLGFLKNEIKNIFEIETGEKELLLSVMSFGFKYGIPLEADLVFDVRFLPNPYYIEKLKCKTGQDSEVQEYVMSYNEAGEFLDKLIGMLNFLIPNYIRESKSQLVIAIGCTGGKHRSVTIANKLSNYLQNEYKEVSLYHRDISRH
jgi:UPF0042 nucleotide-binding protein